MEKLRLDIISENFDQYFEKICGTMGVNEKSQIPIPILSRLFYGKGKVNQKTMDRIGFLGKVFVLFKAIQKRIFIVVEGNDSEGAISVKDFVNFRSNVKEHEYGEDISRQMLTHAHFVVGGKELMDGIAYMNDVCTGPAYNYLTRLKNTRKESISTWKIQREYVVNFLLTFESNKKKWIKEYDISMHEFLVLMYIYTGKDFTGSEIYNKALVNAHYSGASKIREAISSLKNRRYLTKQGVTSGATFRITALGKHIIDQILDKYAIRG